MVLNEQTAAFLLLMLPKVSGSGSAAFSYDPLAQDGPALWQELEYHDGTNNECAGEFNSPIDVQALEQCSWYTNYEFQGGDCTVNDFGFEVSPGNEMITHPGLQLCNPSIMRVPFYDFTFEMKQFHIHTSSEHTINGKHFGAELHAVHVAQEASDLYAVLGFFIEPTATVSHPIFDQILSELDEVADKVADDCSKPRLPHWWNSHNRKQGIDFANTTLNVYDLIPAGATFYNYDGGLTTPPCTEAVIWNLVDTPIQITPAQYTDLVALIVNHVDHETCEYSTSANPYSGSTSRPTQPLNGRRVERFCPDMILLEAEEAAVEAAEEDVIDVDDEETTSDDKKTGKSSDGKVEVSKRGKGGRRRLDLVKGVRHEYS